MEFCNITKTSSPMCLLYQNMKGYLLKGKNKENKSMVLLSLLSQLTWSPL